MEWRPLSGMWVLNVFTIGLCMSTKHTSPITTQPRSRSCAKGALCGPFTCCLTVSSARLFGISRHLMSGGREMRTLPSIDSIFLPYVSVMLEHVALHAKHLKEIWSSQRAIALVIKDYRLSWLCAWNAQDKPFARQILEQE